MSQNSVEKLDKMKQLHIYQGGKELLSQNGNSNNTDEEENFDKKMSFLKDKIRDFLNLKNVNFLFGSGVSAGAIPTMKELFEELSFESNEKEMEKEFEKIKTNVGENLEECLGIMYSAKNYFNGILTTEKSKRDNETDNISEDYDKKLNRCKKELYERLILKVQDHIYNNINIDFKDKKYNTVLEYYQKFYQKLALRNKDNSRIRIFTTNNDLFNEVALDSLNIHYINGFSGGLHKRFNPAIFNYTLSKRMDTTIDKYEPVENMVYLYKIHGSVNWFETEKIFNSFFEIEECSIPENKDNPVALIYPTPTKQDKSLGSPYVDLFREFQNKLSEANSVLFVIGYGFNDRHVNDIIYRALATNSTLNVVIFSELPNEKEKKKKPIFFVNDNRIFVVYGKDNGNTINYFNYIVENLLPDLDAFSSEDNTLKNFIELMKKSEE